MKIKLNHVAITVNDLQESIKWYQEKLAFTLLDTYDHEPWHIARIQSEGIIIELFHFSDGTKPLPDYRKELMDDLHVVGTKHLCLEVESLEETLAELKEKDVEILGQEDSAYFGGDWIFIKDCNGILIELYQK